VDRSTLYREQAVYCAARLHRISDPKRRALVEQEHRDWISLAEQHRSWSGPATTPLFALRPDAG